jgi:signal transduction histidine kinase
MTETGKGYALAVVLTAATLGIVAALDRVLDFPPVVLFAAPVALVARFAGRGPAALVVLLGIVAVDIAFVPPIGTVDLDRPALWLNAVIFAVVAITIDMSSEGLRRAQRQAERHATEVEGINGRLADEIEEVRVLSEHLHETNVLLDAARETAERASRAREEILGVVAHDLRNPLNVVMMTNRLFLECDLPEDRRKELIGVMLRASERMNRLIQDLLDVVRIDSGKMTLDVRDVSARAVLADALEVFRDTAAAKGIRLQIETPRAELVARADADRLQQALGNLIGNALKHVPRGGRVAVDCTDRGMALTFAVQDDGPGIPADQLQRLFEKFWQASRTDRRGVGLGLSIARGIADAHGGRLWAESEVGKGATFYLSVPAAEPARQLQSA